MGSRLETAPAGNGNALGVVRCIHALNVPLTLFYTFLHFSTLFYTKKIKNKMGGGSSFLERLKKYCSHSDRGFLGFGEDSAKEQVQEDPVTEPKRCQNPKRPLHPSRFPNGYSIFENALNFD